MSTPLLDASRFSNLHHSLFTLATDEMGFESCSMLNGELCRVLGISPFAIDATQEIERKIGALCFDWQRANYNAHCVRYCAEFGERPAVPQWLGWRGGLALSAPGTLKALRALRYNCDGGEASGQTFKQSLETLDRLIDVLKDYCLELLPEYQQAEWAI